MESHEAPHVVTRLIIRVRVYDQIEGHKHKEIFSWSWRKLSKHDEKLKLREVREKFEVLSKKPPLFDQMTMARRVEEASLLNRQAYNLYRRQVNKPDEEEVWKRTAELFHKTLSEAYPGGFWQSLERLKKGDPEPLEAGINFLELDPWFFRSGYTKADLVKYVCRIPMSDSQKLRMQNVILAAIDLRDRREFRAYCNAAKYLKSEDFVEQIVARLSSSDEGIQRRARWVLNRLGVRTPN